MIYHKGLLVVIEGVNGAGKSTILKNVCAHYDDLDIPYSLYKFPNRSGPNGKKIDQYLKGELAIPSKYDVLDMFAEDRKHACDQIKRDIAEGKIVLCDRYVFSAVAYHIPLGTKDLGVISNYCNVIAYFDKDMPMPDITFLVKGDFIRERGIVSKEIFHYVDLKQRELHFILGTVIKKYSANLVRIYNRTNAQHNVASDVLNEIHANMYFL